MQLERLGRGTSSRCAGWDRAMGMGTGTHGTGAGAGGEEHPAPAGGINPAQAAQPCEV